MYEFETRKGSGGTSVNLKSLLKDSSQGDWCIRGHSDDLTKNLPLTSFALPEKVRIRKS
jgi:hypothetical protein